MIFTFPGQQGPAGPIGPRGPSGAYSIDFIADCGADPNGVADCTPALQLGLTRAKARAASPGYKTTYDLTIHVPPGVYKFATVLSPEHYDLLSCSSFRILGHRAASIFLIATGDTGAAVAAFANCLFCEIDGISFVGAGSGSAQVDATGIFNLNAAYQNVVRNVLIQNCVTSAYGIRGDGGETLFYNCFQSNSACTSATGALWLTGSSRYVAFEACSMIDPALINGVSAGAGRTDNHKNHIAITGACRAVSLRGVFVDEACITDILIGDGTNQIGIVEALSLNINAPVIPGGNAGLHIRKARNVIVRGITPETGTSVPMVKLDSVDRADISNVRKVSGSPSAMIVADANCKWLRVADIEGFDQSLINAHSSIPTKFLDQYGVITNL